MKVDPLYRMLTSTESPGIGKRPSAANGNLKDQLEDQVAAIGCRLILSFTILPTGNGNEMATDKTEFKSLISQFRFSTAPIASAISTPPNPFPSTPPRSSPKRPKAGPSSPSKRSKSTPSPHGSSPYFISPNDGLDVSGGPIPPGGSPSPKKKKPARAYADPVVYAHLDGLSDLLPEEVQLNLVLVGINPGVESATQGHHCEFLFHLTFVELD